MRKSNDKTKLDQVHEALETSLDSTDSPPLEIFPIFQQLLHSGLTFDAPRAPVGISDGR